ncbi:hypothetical protein P3L10_024271 [Capsicum annuum]
MKMQFLNFCYSKLDPISAEEKVKLIKKRLYKIYEQCASKQNVASASSTILTTRSEVRSKSKSFKVFSKFKAFENEPTSSDGKSELNLYLEEPTLDLENF